MKKLINIIYDAITIILIAILIASVPVKILLEKKSTNQQQEETYTRSVPDYARLYALYYRDTSDETEPGSVDDVDYPNTKLPNPESTDLDIVEIVEEETFELETETTEEYSTDNQEIEIVEEEITTYEEIEIVEETTTYQEIDVVEEPSQTLASDSYSEQEIYELAKIIMAEAEGQSFQCKQYVGQVVMNRVKEYNMSIHDVIFANNGRVYQFSPVIPGGRWYRVEPNQECYDAAYSVLNTPEPFTDALYFEDCVGSSWHSRNLTRVATIDGMRFYIK
jgi:spore germination cell wall hydrolase CwlJ-like protein